jgi:hypothetical protein
MKFVQKVHTQFICRRILPILWTTFSGIKTVVVSSVLEVSPLVNRALSQHADSWESAKSKMAKVKIILQVYLVSNIYRSDQ